MGILYLFICILGGCLVLFSGISQLFKGLIIIPALHICLGIMIILYSINLMQEKNLYITEEMYSKQHNILDNCNVISKTILKTVTEDEFYIRCESRKTIEVDKNVYEKYHVKSTEQETLLYKIGMFFKTASTLTLFISAIMIGVFGSILKLLFEKF